MKSAEPDHHAESSLIALADSIQEQAGALSGIADAFDVVLALLEQLPFCVTVGNSEGWQFVSRRFSDLLGYDREDLGATPFEKLIHPDDLEETQRMARMVEAGELAHGEVVNRYRVRGTDRYQRIRWRWGPPQGDMNVSVAVGEIVP